MQTKNFIDLIKGKQILLHISIWAVFICFCLMHPKVQSKEMLIQILLVLCVNITLFYINYLYLVSHFLLKNKKLLYLVLVFISIVISLIIFSQLTSGFESSFESSFKPMLKPEFEKERPNYFFIFKFLGPLIFNILLVATGTGFRVYTEWNRNERTKKEIESQKFSTELHFLKHQLNPHFLFNSLNSIYSLTSKKSNDAPEAVITLSELMRYMLYETNSKSVLLKKELEYIQNYLKLQRLRIANNKDVTLNIHGSVKDQKITPLLFISFIENAFKYGTDFKGYTEVKIKININDDNLKFSCTNIIGYRKEKKDSPGIGLENTKNRLEFLYPKKHVLTIEEKDNRFIVNLEIKLN